MIKEVSEFILQRLAHSYWERDINFFVGHLPTVNKEGKKVEEITRICAVLENTPADTIGDLPDRADKPIQIYNWNNSYFSARVDAFEFHTVLHGSSQWQLPIIESGSEYTAMIIDSYATPAPIESPNERGLYIFSCNYLFRIAG
jgi:hypothetical protein